MRITWSYGLFVALLIAAFAGVAWLAYDQVTSVAALRDQVEGWKVVPAKIEQVKILQLEHPGGKRYREATATYSYTYDGKLYRSSRVYLDPEISLQGGTNVFHSEIENAARTGKPVDVHVNPVRPFEAALFLGLPSSMFTVIFFGVVFGIAALALTLLLAYAIVRKPASG